MKILKTEKLEYIQYAEVEKIKIEMPEAKQHSLMAIGIDPGSVNMGIAKVWRNFIVLYQAKMKNEDAIQRIIDVQHLLSDTLEHVDSRSNAVIEGASFGHLYRQVELAEIRTASILWLLGDLVNVELKTPLTIRKEVFGDGKIKAEEVWKDLPGDAASALACAYSAIKIKIPI